MVTSEFLQNNTFFLWKNKISGYLIFPVLYFYCDIIRAVIIIL